MIQSSTDQIHPITCLLQRRWTLLDKQVKLVRYVKMCLVFDAPGMFLSCAQPSVRACEQKTDLQLR